MPEAPFLILLPASLASFNAAALAPAHDGEPMILGLSLTRRAVLAAQRAGYAQVFLLAANGHVAPGVAAVPDWGRLAKTLASLRTAPLMIAPATILAQTDWLRRLAETRIEPALWATIPNKIVMLAAASALEALEALDEEGGARDLIAVEGRLARRYGSDGRRDVDGRPGRGMAPAADAG
jgi:hypothetical protein